MKTVCIETNADKGVLKLAIFVSTQAKPDLTAVQKRATSAQILSHSLERADAFDLLEIEMLR